MPEEVNIEKIKEGLAKRNNTNCYLCSGNIHREKCVVPCGQQLEAAQEQLEYLASQGFCIIAKDQTLPEIPGFQYDKEEYRPYLIRGAINYSKLLSGFKWVMPLQDLMEGKEK